MAAATPDRSRDQSRDTAALGAETLAKFSAMRVLVVGLKSLGVEIAKNVILTGPGSVALFDPQPVVLADLGLNYYLKTAHIGHPRAAASLPSLAELNEFVRIGIVDAPALTEAIVGEFDALVFTDTPRAELLRWNAFARSRGIAFLAADVKGAASYFFSDFGPRFTVKDSNGENPKSAVVGTVESSKGGDALYVLTDASQGRMHNFGDGDYVVFREVEGEGASKLNDGVPRKIRESAAFGFELLLNAGETVEMFAGYTTGGMVSQVKVPFHVEFESLATRLEQPYPVDDPTGMGCMITADMGKFGRAEQLHVAFQALESFREAHGGNLPELRNAEHASEVVALAKAWVADLSKKGEALKAGIEAEVAASGMDASAQAAEVNKRYAAVKPLSLDAVEEDVVRRVALLARAELAAVSTFMSGVVSQEIVKLTGKFTPMRQYFYYDCFEALPTLEAEGKLPADEFTPIGSRYDDLIAIFGRTIQKKLLSQRVFLVGCGALGCELLKNFAQMGLGCSPEGEIIATDMDTIELSNLSRQFLYRRRHVREPKSVVSTAEIRHLNPDINTRALQVPVGPTTENVFNPDFWKGCDFVVNALDNVEARKYVDEKCVFFAKPMFDSGTLGIKANTQVVIPFHTECYGDNDDGAGDEEAIPMCTIRELPYLPDHCIEWARNVFAGEFFDGVRGAAALRGDPTEWFSTQRAALASAPTPEAIRQVLLTLQTARNPSFHACLAYARALFNTHFYAKIRDVTTARPRDYAKDGTKYWSGRRRFPTAIEFDVNDELHRAFLVHTTALAAQVYGVKLAAGWDTPAALSVALADVPVAPWTPRAMVGGDESKGEEFAEFSDPATAAIDFLGQIEALIGEVGGGEGLKALTLTPQEFEKDDDSNHHVDFMAAATNLRAANFGIPPSDRITVRVTAGKIIPAIANTTTMITGLVAVEILKLVAGVAPDAHRNAFVSLATNLFSIAEPAGPKRTRSRKYSVTFQGPVRALPEGFTRWHYLEFEEAGALTPAHIEEFLEREHKVKLKTLYHGDRSLFISKLAKHRTERASKSLVEIYSSVLKKVPEGKFLVFHADVADETSSVRIPPLRLHL